ncbi:MAG: serine hydrolase, partial [Ferruginibacter sp.]|nr:serine hydrolase [Chitinophagaceae bacterium]
MRYCLPAVIFFLFPVVAGAQLKNDAFLKNMLAVVPDSLLQAVLNQPETYRYQVIYTQINRDKKNNPSFTHYYYNVDAHRYFNPASVVKLPLAFLSLEKLNTLQKPGVNKYTTMQFDSAWSRQTTLYTDSTAENKLPSLAQFIRKAFLISDNDAYNRMYEFVGQETTNRRLHKMGYPETRITRRFMRMTTEENRHTNPIRFINNEGSLIYQQPMEFNRDSFDFSHVYKMGKGHLNSNDSLVNEPIDFTKANNYPLEDMQQHLQAVLFPNSVKKKQRYRLGKEDVDFLYRFLSQYPSETDYPK